MTDTIRVITEGDLAVVQLDDGKANTLHTESCRELVRRFDEVEAAGHRAVVLTGAGAMFSAGVDLRRVYSGGASYVAEFLPALSDALLAVFGFPRPVVAALNGHAIAGGAVLAAACDHRVLNAERGKVGITELLVGLPFPLAALEILRCGFGADVLPGLAYTGRTYEGVEALRLGLVDEIAEPGAVLARAKELATQLGKIPAEAFAHTKAQLHQPFHERIAEHRTGDDHAVERMWSSAESAASAKSYVDEVLR